MPAGGLLTTAITLGLSAAGGALSNKTTKTSVPTLDPAYQGLQGQILKMIQTRLGQTGGLPAGYAEGGVKQINSAFDLTKQASDNNLTARGLATSPVAATVDATRNVARTGQIGQFQAGLPLVAQNLDAQNLQLGNSILAGGRGETSTGESGGGAGGAATNLAGMLGYLYKKNQQPAAGSY